MKISRRYQEVASEKETHETISMSATVAHMEIRMYSREPLRTGQCYIGAAENKVEYEDVGIQVFGYLVV